MFSMKISEPQIRTEPLNPNGIVRNIPDEVDLVRNVSDQTVRIWKVVQICNSEIWTMVRIWDPNFRRNGRDLNPNLDHFLNSESLVRNCKTRPDL